MDSKRKLMRSLFAAGILLPLAVLAGCGGGNATSGGGAAADPPKPGAGQPPAGAAAAGQQRQPGRGFSAIPVLAVAVHVGPLTASNDTSATVAPYMQSTVAAQVAGVVLRVVHLAGDWVREGEPVVVLDTSQLKLAVANAQAALESARINYQVGQDNASSDNPKLTLQLQSAQSALDSAQKNADAQTALFKVGGAPASAVDNAKSQLQQAQANLQAAQTALEQNKKSDVWTLQQLRLAIDQAQVQLQTAQLNLEYASIKAPYAGQISAVNVNPGMYVTQNTPVFIIVSSRKEIIFNVPPADAPNLPVGTTVQFTYQGHATPVKVSQAPSAPINGVIPMVTDVPRSFTLPYGAVGTVSYSLTIAQGAIVPIGALQTNEDQNYVFAVVNGKAVTRNIKILGQSETSAVVAGVEDGAQVIMNAPPGLLEGSSVQVTGSLTAPGTPSASPQGAPAPVERRAPGAFRLPNRERNARMKTLRNYEAKVFNKINPLVRFSVTRYVLAIGIFVAVFVFGFVSLRSLGVDLLPDIQIPAVVVKTTYPGATPSVMDLQVTQVIENVVSSISGITDVNSRSSLGLGISVFTFDPSTDKYADANQVATAVSASVGTLPKNVTPPTIQTFDPNSAPVLQFGLSGQGVNLADVSDYVQNILGPSIERVDGVATVLTDGAPTKQFTVLLNPDKLRYYNLRAQDVVNAISGSALNMPIGTIVKNKNDLTFQTQNQPADLHQISRTLVDSTRGIFVDQLGAVWSNPASSDYARVNGNPEVLISIQRTTDSNAVAVVEKVKALLQSTALPARWELHYSNDTTEPIKASVNATYHELFVTALVVALIVLLFLGKLNTALSVILAIPIALSASPVLYKMAGFSLNQVSLLALITAIGIVVDDSIVVSENVERYLAMGFTLKESVLRGASEVFSAVVAASLSLLSVLLPVSFIGGFIGAYIQQFSLGMAAAVAFSLLEAVLFLTVRLAYTPELKPLTWGDFMRSWLLLPESIRWGWKAWRKVPGIVVGVVAAILILVFTHKPLYLVTLAAYPIVLGLALLLRPHCLVSSPGLDDPSARLDRKGPGVGSRPLRPVARRGPARRTLGSDRVCRCHDPSRRSHRAAHSVQLRAQYGCRGHANQCPQPSRHAPGGDERRCGENRGVPFPSAGGADGPVGHREQRQRAFRHLLGQ